MSDPQSRFDSNAQRLRRSQGQIVVARALWYVKPGIAEVRPERLSPPSPGEARIATEYSAISRGTERMVALDEIPQSEWARMRAPLQAGDFSFPVKYGYSATGVVTAGSERLVGKRVFVLHPHQDHFHAPEALLAILPDNVPSRRAVLAANMETALNAHWDAGTTLGDRVLVVGAGIVGLLTAHLANRIAGTDVTITDINPARAKYAEKLGIKFVSNTDVPAGNRIVFHASATSAGLETAINACAFEGSVIEMSWYGTNPVTVNLGGAFHSRRLKIISSQVGHVAPLHRNQLKHKDRLERAIAMLDDDRLDALVADAVNFEDLPSALPKIWSSSDLPPIVRY
ncbi:2-desacetyl-2-hydroxyethyl bacteriochlorophyllide A dehydrogenase [Hyphomicrobium facile]|uniref:2-desacetyl-2-hydroxyethyl bacteriochlorophyllide A dehydrogenase n=1 Tax=Hyphomicrobium facile TaxID=51670 RepID=A0A1I7ND27_9HYPH|nr:zinc-binding alcohol dehydrogenase [Hyphomicrobium facile]SFV32560.1 2-desacetyl-2-hydroxyethyl bacteriochlorophyllide A dehydrogenase [Hyphomicrobium facile]